MSRKINEADEAAKWADPLWREAHDAAVRRVAWWDGRAHAAQALRDHADELEAYPGLQRADRAIIAAYRNAARMAEGDGLAASVMYEVNEFARETPAEA